jgi:hypothetical protein
MEMVETGEISFFCPGGKKRKERRKKKVLTNIQSTGFHYKTFTGQRHPPFSDYFYASGPD